MPSNKNMPSGTNKPKETVNTVSEVLQDLQNEILDLRRKLAASDAQVQRIHRTVRLDEKEFAVGKMQSERALLTAVQGLTQTVDALAQAQTDAIDRVEREGDAIWKFQKEQRHREVRRNLAHIKFMSTLRQENTYVCPCGEHMGIKFSQEDGLVVEENMCPKEWWIKLSRLAYDEGHLAKFNKETPLSDYLKAYALGGEGQGEQSEKEKK